MIMDEKTARRLRRRDRNEYIAKLIYKIVKTRWRDVFLEWLIFAIKAFIIYIIYIPLRFLWRKYLIVMDHIESFLNWLSLKHPRLYVIVAFILWLLSWPIAFTYFFLSFLRDVLKVTFQFNLLFWFVNPYISYDKYYKAGVLLFIERTRLKFIRLSEHMQYVYLVVFYINYINFYVKYLWRPRNFLILLTIGPALRVLECLTDMCIDTCESIIDVFKIVFYTFFKTLNRIRRYIVLKLRVYKKGVYYTRVLMFKYFFLTSLFFFLCWYFNYFLLINSKEIGPWWGNWSIPSFLFFFTSFWFCYFYFCFRRWYNVREYLDDYFSFIWYIIALSWMSAQYAEPASWGIPPGDFLPRILSFWF